MSGYVLDALSDTSQEMQRDVSNKNTYQEKDHQGMGYEKRRMFGLSGNTKLTCLNNNMMEGKRSRVKRCCK